MHCRCVHLAVLVACGLPAAARAEDEKVACVAAAEKAQSLRSAGKLVEARNEVIACSRPECPAIVRTDCIHWLDDLERRVPTIVFRATDAGGRDVSGVTVDADGVRVANLLDGRAIPVDPGSHTFRFRTRSRLEVERSFVIAEGERARVVVVAFDAPLAADGTAARASSARDQEPSASTHSPLFYVSSAVAVVGLGSFVGFELLGQSEYRSLRDGCGATSSCAHDDVTAARTKFIAAGISLGVAIAAAGVAAVLFVLEAQRAPKRDAAMLHF
jgi:hypothetical protein